MELSRWSMKLYEVQRGWDLEISRNLWNDGKNYELSDVKACIKCHDHSRYWTLDCKLNHEFGRIGYVEMGVLGEYLLCLPCPDTLWMAMTCILNWSVVL